MGAKERGCVDGRRRQTSLPTSRLNRRVFAIADWFFLLNRRLALSGLFCHSPLVTVSGAGLNKQRLLIKFEVINLAL